MIPYKQGVILSVNAILLCLFVILWFPIHQQHLVRNVLNSIAINEELYFMDVLMFGSISTLVDTVPSLSFHFISSIDLLTLLRIQQ